jgi:hypothetical protein
VAVVVDHLHIAGSRSIGFQADAAGSARTQSDVVLKDLRTDQFWNHFRAALYDRRCLARVGGRIPLAHFGGAPEDAVTGTRVDVGTSLRVLLVSDRNRQARIHDPHNVAPHRDDRLVAAQLTRPQPRTVDDDLPVGSRLQ